MIPNSIPDTKMACSHVIVSRLQQKVQKCLEDGVRLDLKHLQVENSQLLERRDRSGKVRAERLRYLW